MLQTLTSIFKQPVTRYKGEQSNKPYFCSEDNGNDFDKIVQKFLKIRVTAVKFQDYGCDRSLAFDGTESISTLKNNNSNTSKVQFLLDFLWPWQTKPDSGKKWPSSQNCGLGRQRPIRVATQKYTYKGKQEMFCQISQLSKSIQHKHQ